MSGSSMHTLRLLLSTMQGRLVWPQHRPVTPHALPLGWQYAPGVFKASACMHACMQSASCKESQVVWQGLQRGPAHT